MLYHEDAATVDGHHGGTTWTEFGSANRSPSERVVRELTVLVAQLWGHAPNIHQALFAWPTTA